MRFIYENQINIKSNKHYIAGQNRDGPNPITNGRPMGLNSNNDTKNIAKKNINNAELKQTNKQKQK